MIRDLDVNFYSYPTISSFCFFICIKNAYCNVQNWLIIYRYFPVLTIKFLNFLTPFIFTVNMSM